MPIQPGNIVVAVLHTPREKLVGVLDEINPAGISMRSVDLGYFDDWCASIAAGDEVLPMTDNFFPMWRVERISRDEPSGGAPSLADEFEARTGKSLGEF